MTEKNPYNIQIETYRMGEDLAFLIFGGKAHIGASVIAYHVNGEIRVEAINLPEHCEGPLAAELAKRAAEKLGVTVNITMGIHVDSATKEIISSIVSYVQDEMTLKIEELESKLVENKPVPKLT